MPKYKATCPRCGCVFHFYHKPSKDDLINCGEGCDVLMKLEKLK